MGMNHCNDRIGGFWKEKPFLLLAMLALFSVSGCGGSSSGSGGDDGDGTVNLNTTSAAELEFSQQYDGVQERAQLESAEQAAAVTDLVYLGERLRMVREGVESFLDESGSEVKGDCGEGTASFSESSDNPLVRNYQFDDFCLRIPRENAAGDGETGEVVINGSIEMERSEQQGGAIETWTFEGLVYNVRGLSVTLWGVEEVAVPDGEDSGEKSSLAMDIGFNGDFYRFLSKGGGDTEGFRDVRVFHPALGYVDASGLTEASNTEEALFWDPVCSVETASMPPDVDSGGLRLVAAEGAELDADVSAVHECGRFELSGTLSGGASLSAKEFPLLGTLPTGSNGLALHESLVVSLSDNPAVPASMEGTYHKAFDCEADEGGASFGGVDHAICYRKDDLSKWRAWNTGCGWEFGRMEDDGSGNLVWERYARTYSGQCSDMPKEQYASRALETETFYDNFGNSIEGISSRFENRFRFELVSGGAAQIPSSMTGFYRKEFNCERSQGGATFGDVDHKLCYKKTDGSDWKAWNTGCGWEFGRMEDDGSGNLIWERYARTYSGQCSDLPSAQLASRALEANTLYDGTGGALDQLQSFSRSKKGQGGREHISVTLDEQAAVPTTMAGQYEKAFDCTTDEGGAQFGGVDHAICFRQSSGSRWRAWNTGCGWELGRMEDDGTGNLIWERYARTYSGQCSDMPMDQYATRALDTTVFYDGFGDQLSGISASVLGSPALDVSVDAGAAVPSDMAGLYEKAFDCSRDNGGGWSGGVDYQVCYRKKDGSSWKAWNTGCGWEFGRMEDDGSGNLIWERYARTYSGQCSDLPSSQLSVRALDTSTFYDGAGDSLQGVESRRVR